MEFLTALKNENNVTYTENNAKTNKSSLDPNVDFFGLAGAMRNNLSDAIDLFEAAYKTDPLLTVRTLFYLRDIRGGQGERNLFRVLLSRLYSLEPEIVNNIVKYIPTYGRWDDLPLTTSSVKLIADQFDIDEAAMNKGEQISLMAKWLPSENASSKKTKASALALAQSLSLSPAQYRRKVVALRKYIKLLEQKMSFNDWEIDYARLPSQALRKHTKAFRRHDEGGYQAFLDAVDRGEKTINTSTLFTYEVMELLRQDEKTANTIWNNLPDYTNGKNAIVVADVSGSMGMWGYKGSAINVSISLALYFAERNSGPLKGYFMTFSERSDLVEIKGTTLTEKVNNISRAHWSMNTNVMAAFMSILNAAKTVGMTNEDIPKTIYIISDMQFDQCVADNSLTNFERAKKEYEMAGLTLPHVVFWNVEARSKELPATILDGNVTLISGLSQSTFRYAVENKSPRESMEDILNSERYSQIVL